MAYAQLSFYQHIFDVDKAIKERSVEEQSELFETWAQKSSVLSPVYIFRLPIASAFTNYRICL